MSVTKEQIEGVFKTINLSIFGISEDLNILLKAYKEAIEALREVRYSVGADWRLGDDRIGYVNAQIEKTQLKEIEEILDKYPEDICNTH